MATLIENGLFPWQAEAIKQITSQKCDILLLTGGFGSGKTAVNAHIIRKLCFEQNRQGIVIGNTFSTLRDTVGITLDDELGSTFIKDKRLSSPMAWYLLSKKGTSTLLSRTMRYGHEAQPRLKSINADFLWLVEATELPREAFTIGLSRMRKSGKAGYYPIIMETNPSSKSNWVYKMFIDGAKEVYRDPNNLWWVEKKNVEQKLGREIINLRICIFHTTTQANTEFPSTTLAFMLSTYSPSEVQRLVYGEWNSLEGRVWEYYETFPQPTDTVAWAARYDQIIIGIDPGQTHPTAVVMIGFAGGVWEVFEEYYDTNRSVREVHKEVLQRLQTWGIDERDYMAWVDPSGKQWVKEWNNIAGNRINAYQATHKGTDPALNRAVRLGEFLRTKRLKINANCHNVIRDIEQTVFQPGTFREIIDKQKYDPHAMDAVGYGMSRM